MNYIDKFEQYMVDNQAFGESYDESLLNEIKFDLKGILITEGRINNNILLEHFRYNPDKKEVIKDFIEYYSNL